MLLTTKIIPPSIKPTVLPRQRLLDAVKDHLDRKLLLVTGGGGYGKTTLLAQVIHQAGLPCVYCTLDEDDGDFMVFFSYLVEGCKRIDQKLVEYSQKLLATGGKGGDQYRVFMGTLLNELVEKRKEELFIVLDDYHSLGNGSPVHQAVDYFVDHLPDHVHVVIATRHEPPLKSLPKWRARQDVYEIGSEGLKFTAEETTALVREVYRTEVPDAELSRMGRKTEGWATGIQLIMNSATRDGRTVKETLNGMLSDDQPVFEYFASEIMAGETPETREFLARAAVLEELTPEACFAVFGMKDAEKRLKELAARNLFITASGKGRYRMHELFQEYLAQSESGAVSLRKVHRLAGAFYQKQDLKAQALRHLLIAGDYRSVAPILNLLLKDNEYMSSFVSLGSILKKIPEGERNFEPVLSLLDGMVLEGSGDFDGALRAYQNANKGPGSKRTAILRTLIQYSTGALHLDLGRNSEAGRTLENAIQTCPVGNAYLRVEMMIAMLTALLNQDRLARSRQLITRIQKLIKPQDVRRNSFVHSRLAGLWFKQGEPQKTLLINRKLVESWDSFFQDIGIYISSAARYALIAGDEAWAEKVLNRGWEMCRPYSDEASKKALLFGFGHLHLYRGEWDKAEKVLSRSLQEHDERGYKLMQVDVLCQLCQLYRFKGNTDGAANYLGQARKIEQGMEKPVTLLDIEQAILYLLRGEVAEAGKLLKRLPSGATPVAIRLRVRTLLLEAAILHDRGDRLGGMSVFKKAIEYSGRKGYDGVLSLESRYGAHLRELVNEWQRSVAKRGPERIRFDRLMRRNAGSEGGVSITAVTVTMYGKFSVEGIEGNALPRMQRRASRAILAWFLLQPNRESTWEEVVSWAWPDMDRSIAHQSFRSSLLDIRRSFPQDVRVIEYHEGLYRLDARSGITTDVSRFQELLNRAAAEEDKGRKLSLLEQAIGLYTGPLMPEFYYTWLEEYRGEYAEKFIMASRKAAKIIRERGEHERAIELLRNGLKANPFDEETHRMLISCYIALGNKTRALEQYYALKKLLKLELKTDPSVETNDLIKALL
jgi:LuxR family maltose regulon positive regulatory protein